VKNRYIALSFIAIVATVAIVFSACKKINESTDLGGGLIPPIDNITTFDTSLTVQAFNDTFGLATDSQRLAASEEHFLGLINNDPFFGKTDARIFVELKPATYGVYPFPRKDSIKMDSIVLVMDYLETYGDTNIAQTINVYEINQASNFTRDSVYLIRKNDITYTNQLSFPSNQSFFPRNLDDSIKAFRDTTSHQLRIKLDTNFARRLFNYDTTNAYRSDSAFRTYFKGFALQSINTGNAVMGFDLSASKLAIYFRQPKTIGTLDSTNVSYFVFTQRSATANYVQRNYSGTPLLASLNNGTTPDPVLYIQNTPGTFSILKIPALSSLSNRTIHRAELIVEQLYDGSDTVFRAPDYLYLDASDPTITTDYKFRTIPYDLSFTSSGALNFNALGVIPVNSVDASGHPIKVWKFNISRYVQHVLTHTQSLYDLRLLSPFTLNEKFGIPPAADITATVFLNPAIVKGRVRLEGNTGPADPNPHRMRLRLIYSKL
jgi:hypothetical protein